MKLKVFKADGSHSTEKDFPHFPEFEGDRGIATLRQVVIAQQANKRQGNASTKTRAEVAGSGKSFSAKKVVVQHVKEHVEYLTKDTVVWLMDRQETIHKNESQDAPVSDARALFDRAVAGGLSVIEDLAVEAPKTKIFNNVLKNVYPERCKVLVVDDTFAENTAFAARNIQGVSLAESGDLSVLDIVKYQNVIVSSKAIETIIARAVDGKETSNVSTDTIIKSYIVTEKAANVSANLNQYTFKVAANANRIEVARAIEKLFNVAVTRVNILNVKPKLKTDRSRRVRLEAKAVIRKRSLA